jgi:hypothetical protein
LEPHLGMSISPRHSSKEPVEFTTRRWVTNFRCAGTQPQTTRDLEAGGLRDADHQIGSPDCGSLQWPPRHSGTQQRTCMAVRHIDKCGFAACRDSRADDLRSGGTPDHQIGGFRTVVAAMRNNSGTCGTALAMHARWMEQEPCSC